MKVLITGGAGFLGSTLLRRAPKKVRISASYHHNHLLPKGVNCQFFPLDIRDQNQVVKVISQIKPEVIIHTAAKGNPDFCEKNPTQAKAANVWGTKNILSAAEKVGARIIFTSTNQVFDGDHPPFKENSPLIPKNNYGRTKVQAEKVLQKSRVPVTIARLITMYGWPNPEGQKNMAFFTITKLTQKEPVKIVDDMFGNYLYVEQAAEALWELVQNHPQIKLVHLAGNEKASLYDFACLVAEVFKLDKNLISPVPKSYFSKEAPRPLDTTYDIDYYKKVLKTKPLSFQEGLKKMKQVKKQIKWGEI